MSAASEAALTLEPSLAMCGCCHNARYCTGRRRLHVTFSVELSSSAVKDYNDDNPKVITPEWGGIAEAQELFSSLSDPGFFQEPFPVDARVLAREQRLLASWGIGGFGGEFEHEWTDSAEEFRTTVTIGGIVHVTGRVTPDFFRRVYFDGDLIEDGPHYAASSGFVASEPRMEVRGLFQTRVRRISNNALMASEDTTVIFQRRELSQARTLLGEPVTWSAAGEWIKGTTFPDINLQSISLEVGPMVRDGSACIDDGAFPNAVRSSFLGYPPV